MNKPRANKPKFWTGTVDLCVDTRDLGRQARFIGELIDFSKKEFTPAELDRLEGVWNLLHSIRDKIEGR